MALKLYTVVCHDLSRGEQAAQSAHALAGLALAHPAEFKQWDNGTIVLLETTPKIGLHQLVESAKDGKFKHATFVEPDPLWGMGYYPDGRLTAVAFAPNWLVQNVLLADLPLAVRGPENDTSNGSYYFTTDEPRRWWRL